MNRCLRTVLMGAALVLASTLPGCAAPRDLPSATRAAHALMREATIALETVVDEGDRPGLKAALHGACAALVFPHMRGGGFFAGWQAGDGVLMLRDSSSMHWLGPAFFSLGDMSIGPEVAVSKWELIVVFQRCDALGALREGGRTFSFRTSLSRQAAEDDAGLAVDDGIRAFARTEGTSVGVSLHFVELQADDALTAGCYGRPLSPAQVFEATTRGDESVAELRQAMDRTTR
jgi:lipid-binding SYLF domain-containing protein